MHWQNKWGLVFLSLMVVLSCARKSDEQLLNAALDSLLLAIESRQRNEVGNIFLENFYCKISRVEQKLKT